MPKPLYIIIAIIGLLFLANYAQAGIIIRPVINTGLVGYWSFNEGTGTKVGDMSGYGNHGIWNGTGSRWADGKFAKGGKMVSSTSDYVEIDDNPSLRFGTGNFTISAWVKFPMDTSDPAGWNGIVTKGFTTSAPAHTWGLVRGLTSVNQVRYYDHTDAGGGFECQLTKDFSDGWHLVTVVRASTTCSIYDNGVFASSWSSSANLNATVPLRIGAAGDLRNWDGTIDEVRIYNRDLDASEIRRLYESGASRIGINRLGLVPDDFPSNATVSYVRENCTGYSPCYNALATWESNFGGFGWDGCTPGDLTCLNKTAVAKIDGTWNSPDTTAVSIDGWVTDATRYIKIYTTASARHPGKWDDTKYRLVRTTTANYQDVLAVSMGWVYIDGLQIKGIWANRTGGYDIFLQPPDATTVYVSNNIVVGEISGTSSGQGGIRAGYFATAGTRVVKGWNNIVYGFNLTSDWGIYPQHSGWTTCYWYNNTVLDGTRGYAGTGAVFKNNISYNNTDNYSETSHVSSTNNLSGPSSDAQTPSTNARNGVRVNFVDEANKDFHLSPADSGARNYGADLSNDANISFSTDIDRQNRMGNWDIGADEARGTVIGGSQANQITNGLIGYWSFNGPDIDGNRAIDRSGQGNHGTISGAIPDGGKVGQALSFDGADDYVTGGMSGNLDSGLTIIGWMNPNGTAANRTLVGRGGTTNAGFWTLDFRFNNRIAFTKDGSTDLWARTAAVFTTRNWQHFAVTWTGGTTAATDVLFYRNGTLVAHDLDVDGVSLNSDSGLNFGIGAQLNPQNYFNGNMDEVRVYNRVLTVREIQRLYNLGR